MKKTFFILLSIVFGSMALTSCGDKYEETPESFEGIYYQEGTTDREYFEKVANTMLGYVKPQSQKQAITALKVFSKYCMYYDFPEEFQGKKDLARAADDIADCIDNYDFAGLSRALTSYAYSYSQLLGLYQADSNERCWRRLENRDNLDFKFYDGTQEYNMQVTGLGGTWSASYETSDAVYRFEVPKRLDVILSAGANTASRNLVTAKILTEYNEGSSVNINTTVRFADIQIDYVINATNSKIVNDMTVYEHDPSTMIRTVIAQSTATINGQNICSMSAWRNIVNSDNPDKLLAKMFADASMTLMLYKSVQIKGTVKNLQAVIDNADGWWSTEDVSDPRAAAEKAASALQGCITAEFRYCSDVNNKLRGTMGWQPYVCDDWYGGEAWAVRPTLTFTSDNSTFDFVSFFGNKRFQTVENTINSLIGAYRSYWR